MSCSLLTAWVTPYTWGALRSTSQMKEGEGPEECASCSGGLPQAAFAQRAGSRRLENHIQRGCFQQELLKLPGREAGLTSSHSLAAQPLHSVLEALGV